MYHAEITIHSDAPNPASVLIGFNLFHPPGTYKIVATPNGQFASASFAAPDCSA
jgi:hypothetical protein